MPVKPIKFRCYRCNRLLGVAAHKVGTVVSCPKCAAELLVPATETAEPEADPGQALRGLVVSDPRDATDDAQAGSEPLTNFPVAFETPGLGAGGPPAFPAIETEPTPLRSATPRPPGPPAPELAGGFPAIETEPEPLRSEPAARRSRRSRPEPPPEPTRPETGPSPMPWPSPGPEAFPAVPLVPALRIDPEPRRPELIPPTPTIPAAGVVQALASPLSVVPPLAVEPPTSLTERGVSGRRNDVTIPRTAFLLWSFMMLLTLVAAFAAGLLTGHFLWKEVPTGPATVAAPRR